MQKEEHGDAFQQDGQGAAQDGRQPGDPERVGGQQNGEGRQRGHGSRRGRSTARKPSKEVWMQAIRPVRRKLRELRDEGKIDSRTYRRYYLKAKGGMFKGRSHLESHLRSEGILKE